jgi:hypothetical protein
MKNLLLVVLFFCYAGHAQFRVAGVLKDQQTNKPLAFATITAINGAKDITDTDGKFTIESDTELPSLTFSYLGYTTRSVTIQKGKYYYSVTLSPVAAQLNDVVVNKEDSIANAIIKKVIAAKDNNNPEKKLKSFQFKVYNKLVVTANPDSISSQVDSVFIKKRNRLQFSKVDSSGFKFKKLISSQHLFQTEKVSQFQFVKPDLKETILGIKMSGFDKPVYEIISFHLQSFSVYDSKYELFETKYPSPVASDAFRNYNFRLLDTLLVNHRKTFLIQFKPQRKHSKNGLQGILYIDKENYAIAKAIFRLTTILDITSKHEFEFLDDQKLWFPTIKDLKVVKGKNKQDITILGETFKFDGDADTAQRKKQSSDYTYLQSRSYYFDKQYDIPVQIKRPGIGVEIRPDAINKKEDFWSVYRKDTLDPRSQKTYVGLDSIAKKEKVEKKLLIGRRILKGYLPLGLLDVNLRYLISFNNYEGFRLGFGGVTNEQFSNILKIESYTAYGTKDGNFKYNLGMAVRVGKTSGTWIGGAYTDDVREIASTAFAIDKRTFRIYDARPINLSTFYGYTTWRGYIETKIIPKTESLWQLSYTDVVPKFNYLYNLNGKLYNKYSMTTAMASLQWNPFSDYMQTPDGRIESEKKYPRFTFQFTKSLHGINNNDFDFGKIDFRTEYSKQYMNGQRTNLLLQAGYAFGELPLTHLYNVSPNNLTKDNILQRVTLSGKNSFETMFFNEFFSSKYITFHFKHALQRVKIVNKIKPSLVLVSRMAFGGMDYPERHLGITYKTLNEGFFESGVELNRIYKGFGLSGFYRYGPNQLPRFEDNIAIKVNFNLDLGL